MKKKVIIIISLIAVFALGGSIALAATADGQFVNPFSKILGEKVEDGTITEDEANVFSKVWDAIRGDRDDENFYGHGMMGRRPGFQRPEFDEETIAAVKAVAEEIREAVEVKIDEVVAGLVSEGYITQEDVDSFEDRPMELWWLVKDADEETQDAVKTAMAEVMEYHKSLIDEKIESGELTEETAGLLIGGRAGFVGCGMDSFRDKFGRFPGFDKETDGN
jgi:polyhydroxyalkanoate synthesis regulator phasin